MHKTRNLLQALILLGVSLLVCGPASAETITVKFVKDKFNNTTTTKTSTYGTIEWQTTLAKEIKKSNLKNHDTDGVQIGNSNDYTAVTISTSGIEGTITNVTFNGRVNSGEQGEFAVSVGGTSWGAETFTSSASVEDHTLQGSGSGEIVITLTPKTATGIYIKSITVEYTPPGEGEVVAAPTFSVPSRTFHEAFTLTLTSATNGADIYYTLDGTEPSTSSTPYATEGIAISTTTTVKAIAVKGEAKSAVVTATYTYSDEEGVAGNYIYEKVKRTDDLVAGGIYLIVNEQNSGAMGCLLSSGKRSSVVCSFTDETITVPAEQIATATGETDKVYELILGGENDAWFFQDAADGTYLSFASTSMGASTTLGEDNYLTISFTTYDNATIKCGERQLYYDKESTAENTGYFRPYTSAKWTVQLYRRVGSFSITKAGYATLYTDKAFVMPEGVKGAVVTQKDETTLLLNYLYPSGTIVPACTPLLLQGEAGTYTYNIAKSEATPTTDNLLHGSLLDATTSVEGADRYYKLSYNSAGEDLGFYWGAADGGPFLSKGGLCFLALEKGNNLSTRRGFPFGEMTTATGLKTISKERQKQVYTLDGRRVKDASRKGIYIVNGKKYIVR